MDAHKPFAAFCDQSCQFPGLAVELLTPSAKEAARLGSAQRIEVLAQRWAAAIATSPAGGHGRAIRPAVGHERDQ
jgi:hypothetical protein